MLMPAGVLSQNRNWGLTKGRFRGRRVGRAPSPLLFCYHLFFCDLFDELKTVLTEVKLIINNARNALHLNNAPDIRLPKYYQNIFNTQSFVVSQTVVMLF